MKLSVCSTCSNCITCRVHLAGIIALTSNNFCSVYKLLALCEHLPRLALAANSHRVAKQRALVLGAESCGADSLLVCVDRDKLGQRPLAMTFCSATADGCGGHFLNHCLAKKEAICETPPPTIPSSPHPKNMTELYLIFNSRPGSTVQTRKKK